VNLFPTYLALGDAFCNRKIELKRLMANIQGTNPTLLMLPRRYGKTSLAIKAFEQLGFPYAHMDLYKALAEEEIERVILNEIGQLLAQLETTSNYNCIKWLFKSN
jgi:AAA+ ATPase superfamily predicted ATPase